MKNYSCLFSYIIINFIFNFEINGRICNWSYRPHIAPTITYTYTFLIFTYNIYFIILYSVATNNFSYYLVTKVILVSTFEALNHKYVICPALCAKGMRILMTGRSTINALEIALEHVT